MSQPYAYEGLVLAPLLQSVVCLAGSSEKPMARKPADPTTRQRLTSADYRLLEEFLSVTLDRHKDGLIGREKAVADISHVVAAVDRPEGDDVIAYMRAISKNAEA